MTSKFQLLPEDILKHLDQLSQQSAKVDGLIALWLFGSYARDEATPISDIDLAYLPNKAINGDSLETFETALYNIIADALHTDEFSFVNLERVSPYFAFRVIDEGLLMFCRDKKIVSDFAENIYNQSPDISYLRHKGNFDFLEGFDMSNPIFDKDRVTDFLRFISGDLKDLREKAQISREDYLFNRDLQAVVERRLQTAIESCINIGNHLIARLGLRTPQDYRDVFHILEEYQIIPSQWAKKMMDMARFRNLLVHIYWEIDHNRVHESLPDRIETLESFVSSIAQWIKKHI